jgi:hypothetical protein
MIDGTTLKLGSKGDNVRKWQAIIGVNVDGDFGPATEAATKEWQRKKGLVIDGIVGSASWAVAEGKKPGEIPIQKTVQAPIDQEAYAIAKRAAPDMPENEIQYVLTIARGEGFYGRGWGNPSNRTITDSQSRGLTGYEGKGSNNWGAVQGYGSAGAFSHIDYHADGSMYVANYKRYATPEEGFLDMAKIILRGGKRGEQGKAAIKTAIAKGSLRDAVFAQHANGYFELHPEKYLASVTRNYGILTVNTDWQKLFGAARLPIGKIIVGVGSVIAILIGSILLAKGLRS